MGRRRLRVSSSCFPSFLLPSLKPLLSILWFSSCLKKVSGPVPSTISTTAVSRTSSALCLMISWRPTSAPFASDFLQYCCRDVDFCSFWAYYHYHYKLCWCHNLYFGARSTTGRSGSTESSPSSSSSGKGKSRMLLTHLARSSSQGKSWWVIFPLFFLSTSQKASSSKSKKPQSTFCKEFSASCNRQCSRVRSSIKTQTCKKTGDGPVSDKFDLFCGCRNGKLETQVSNSPWAVVKLIFLISFKWLYFSSALICSVPHDFRLFSPLHLDFSTLSDIGNDGASTETVTVVGTTTSQEVVTSTVVIPVATQTILEPSSTTVVVLAPTGVIRADRKTDGTNFGYLGSSGYGLFDPDSSLVSKVFLVKDPGSTGNYQVGFSLQPSTFWVSFLLLAD